jgi:hypothetical protein
MEVLPFWLSIACLIVGSAATATPYAPLRAAGAYVALLSAAHVTAYLVLRAI